MDLLAGDVSQTDADNKELDEFESLERTHTFLLAFELAARIRDEDHSESSLNQFPDVAKADVVHLNDPGFQCVHYVSVHRYSLLKLSVTIKTKIRQKCDKLTHRFDFVFVFEQCLYSVDVKSDPQGFDRISG